MTKKHEELIKRIIKMTPEQFQRFIDHPEVQAIMSKYEDEKSL